MRKTFIRRLIFVLIFVIISIFSITLIPGCEQSTDKTEAYMDTLQIKYAKFEYEENTNQTKVIWTTTLTNKTIYNFDEFSVKFKLYNNSVALGAESYNYDRGVKHGGDYTGTFSFYVNGEVTAIEYDSWTAHYNSFWATYKIWLIATIAIVCIASLIYIIVMIIQDFDLDDIGDFLSEHWWIFFSLLMPLIGTIWGVVTSYWVPVLIVLGGIVAFILISLLAHLIQFIVGCISDIINNSGYGKCYDLKDEDDEEYFDSDYEDVADYVDDEDTLMLFSVNQLKDYCRDYGIKGFSALNKSNLVKLIVNAHEIQNNNSINKTSKQSVQKLNSNITFNDIAGLEEAKSAFKEKVVYAFEHKELYEKYGKKVGGGLLLYGLPGTGKTMFAEAASNETDALFIPIKCSDIKSKWYGESEANVKKIFEKARKAKKAIIFFDEFEAIGAKRTDNSENGNNDLVPQILAEMQGIGSSNANSIIMVIAATNKPWAIDSAFLRPGRFDEKIYIPLPDFEARKKLFELKLKTVPQENLDFEYLANITDGFNGADIGAFCDKLKMLAINKSIAQNAECPITMDEVKHVQSSIKSSVSDEDFDRLLEFKEHFR